MNGPPSSKQYVYGDRTLPSGNSPAKILVVDDEESIRRLFIELFTRAGGYVVETAQDGYEALQKVILEDFELILMDILMPRMNGLDALKALRMTHPVIPIVVVTGTTDDKMIEKCLAYGAMLALQKPVRPEALLETVGDIRMRLGKVGGKGTL